MTTLTNATIAAAKPGCILRDEAVPGLQLRCFEGRKSFYLWYRTKGGQERKPKLGDHGVLTIAQARQIAREMLGEVAAGRDPSAQRTASRTEPTIADLCDLFMKGKKTKTLREEQRKIDIYIKPKLGSRRVNDDALPELISAMHESMSESPYMANRVLETTRAMFNLAESPKIKWRALNSNPCTHIASYPEKKRKVYARPDQIAKIGPILKRWSATRPRHVAMIYLIAFSGARPTELQNAMWPQLERVDRDGVIHGVIRMPDNKTGGGNIFLPPEAMAIIDTLPEHEGEPILGVSAQVVSALWRLVREEAGCPELRLRDWRRTFATVAFSSKVAVGVVGELLNQKSAQTTMIYAKLMEDAAHDAAGSTASKMNAMLGN